MPNGPQGLDFEPQEKPKEQKPIPWRRVYGVDEEVIPSITGEKPEDADRYGDNSRMGGPGRNGARDNTGTGNDNTLPEGTFPKPGEVFAEDVDHNPSYRVGQESRSEQQARELSEVINSRSRVKPNEPILAAVGGAISIPVANYGFPKLVDVSTRKLSQETTNAPQWAKRAASWMQTSYVPERMTSVDDLMFGNTKLNNINNDARRALVSVDEIIKAGGQGVDEMTHLHNMRTVLNTSLADDAINSAKVAGQQLQKARSLGFAGKEFTSLTDDAFKIAGDDVLKIMTDRSQIVSNAQKEAHRIGSTSQIGEPRGTQMWRAAKLTGTSIAASVFDDSLRGGVNSLASTGRPNSPEFIPTGDDKSGIGNLLFPLALATHQQSKGKTFVAAAGATVLGMGIDKTIQAAGMEDLSDDAWKRTVAYTGTGAGLGLLAPAKTGRGRAAAAVTGLAIGGGMDLIARSSGMSSLTPDSWKRTGIYDGLGLGAGFAVPVKNWKVRVGTVAAGFVAGNLLESAMSGTARGDINPQIEEALKETGETKTDRSLKSLNEAVDAWNTVGSRNIAAEGIAFQQFRAKDAYSRNNDAAKWNSLTPGEQLNNRRELAILARTLGEVRLNGGTKVSYSNSEAQYKLEGMRVDLGGYALEKLLVSQSFATDAIRLTRELDGQEVSGETVNAADEVRALQDFTKQTQERIDEITGVSPEEAAERRARGETVNEEFTKPRNMQEVLDQLEYEYKHGTGIDKFFNQILTDTQYRVGSFLPLTTSEGGKKLVAKLLRDEATIKMSMAQYQMNSGVGNNAVITLQGTVQDQNAPFRTPQIPGRGRMPDIRDGNGDLMKKGYAGAFGALQLAKALDPDNPELKELQRMYDHMLDHARKVRSGQLADPKYNPLQVEERTLRTKDPVYRGQ